jgi:CRP-like cAMP-binding protein/SAM-dependent methyltransferase
MLEVLQLLPEYVLHWLVRNGTERRVGPQQVLIERGTPVPGLYVVLDGLFSVSTPGNEGHVEHASAGTMLGDVSFFTEEPAAATVIAEEAGLVLYIDRKALRDKLNNDRAYAADFYRSLLIATSERYRLAMSQLAAARSEAQPARADDPTVVRARELIARYKRTLVEMDKEAMKAGGISDERFARFLVEAGELMMALHSVLGTESPLPEAQRSALGAELQHEMLPYVLTTETAERFYSKPRGYAGDYLSIHNIYQNQARGIGRMGPIVDRMFLETPPSRAVRNRRTLLAGEIVRSVQARNGAGTRVMCLASGPATEIFDAFEQLPDPAKLKATLLDIDLQALAFVDDLRTRRRLTQQVALVNENLIALFLGRTRVNVEPQDLIYSIGLIDYLNDRLVGKLLQFAHANLAPGGRVLLGNFHPKNPAKEFMDYVLEWNLIHRKEEDMDRLFRESPFQRPSTRIQFEAEGINLFAECVKE